MQITHKSLQKSLVMAWKFNSKLYIKYFLYKFEN